MPTPLSILIVNPNSTTTMTTALEPIITPLLPAHITATYFTGPPDSPPSINDTATSAASATACLPHLLPLLPSHAAVLVACYSDHPLVGTLRALTRVPVVGIFEASLYAALAGEGRFGIVTTGRAWEGLLTEGVERVLGGRGRLGGVESTGFDADQLHAEEVGVRMQEATRRLVAAGCRVVCLGCAGMVGLKGLVGEAAGEGVRVVDGVEAGVGFLVGLLAVGKGGD